MPSSNVVIVEAVRTPIGRRSGGLSTVHPPTCSAPCRRRSSSAPASTRPRSARSSAAASARSASRAFNIARTAWLAAGLPLDVAGHHGRHAVRLVASRPPTWPPSLVGAGVGRRRARLRRRVDEPRPDRRRTARKELGLGIPIPKSYFAQLRDDVAVRGRRAHRRQVGHHPRTTPTRSASQSQQRGRQGVGRGPLRRPVRRRSTRPTSTRRASPTGTTHTVARDEGLRETVAREAGRR